MATEIASHMSSLDFSAIHIDRKRLFRFRSDQPIFIGMESTHLEALELDSSDCVANHLGLLGDFRYACVPCWITPSSTLAVRLA